MPGFFFRGGGVILLQGLNEVRFVNSDQFRHRSCQTPGCAVAVEFVCEQPSCPPALRFNCGFSAECAERQGELGVTGGV